MHYYERWASNQTVCSRYLSLLYIGLSVSITVKSNLFVFVLIP
uniref:Uncharacterized protein n=1 Tax=Arundo donax TaxID=35708 RepID=A0A0A9H762_ARUDO